ncbi:hypothetical protein BABINDRAFT_12389 [Babjeviella inositovora NRRL Y-12698]|uniref:DASH complex subunit DAD2 n=1 Tax=Babjeviella inositovora NRRL Y-12698 TaxID=984486 RepID=A0A1E3QTZ5_9ASCO|nr:uncharacterized protein BABINDRAFT_12389 [Babjeviella inositovora NRRL Y-12698]ODQ81130.1 hypothetical protein BABINDRAFT_12389 [Babjeviella inositovora NRRL Y-12698]
MEKSKLNPITRRIEDKKDELAKLIQVKEYSEVLGNQLELLQEKLSTMADGTEALSLVLSNWDSIIQSVSLASMGLMKYSENDYENEEEPPLPETLVRMRLEPEDE